MISNNDREVLRAGKSISFEETGLKKNKNIHTYISVRFPVYDINSNIYAIGGISTDISERKQAEEALKRMNLELLKTNTDLDNFMYAASHNVKGPASSLEGLINLLDMKLYEPEELDQIIAMMKVSMSNFNQTIADLTELSKVQKLIETQDIIPNDIVAVVEDIKGELTELINNTNATLVTYAEEAPMVWFSKTNFRRILYNLILNAIIYRSPLRKPEIMIKSFQSNGYIVVSVVDNGLGIAKENMEKIFSMFKRAHSHVGGRGVGLYIVKRIIENSGGKIEVQSELGKGAIFNVYFKK
ncbi:MAG TPA: HAMP domain-containing sensor histidine kinase [Cytophagaceae bacterium]